MNIGEASDIGTGDGVETAQDLNTIDRHSNAVDQIVIGELNRFIDNPDCLSDAVFEFLSGEKGSDGTISDEEREQLLTKARVAVEARIEEILHRDTEPEKLYNVTDIRSRLAFSAFSALLDHPESIPPKVLRGLGIGINPDRPIGNEERKRVGVAIKDEVEKLESEMPPEIVDLIINPPKKVNKEPSTE